MSYLATVNVPGYLPMDDEPPVFETAAEAWGYLAEERERGWDTFGAEDGRDDTLDELEALAAQTISSVGTIYGSTPGSDSEHDLGLVYSVTMVDPATQDGE